jgi:hypothetical protein
MSYLYSTYLLFHISITIYSNFKNAMHTGLEEQGSGFMGTGPLEKMAAYFAERFKAIHINKNSDLD